MNCEHDLAEMETMCADGCCPICLQARTAELERAKATLRAYIANVEEASIGVNLPELFITCDENGKEVALKPSFVESWYDAIAKKWKQDNKELIDLYERKNSVIAKLHVERDTLKQEKAELEELLTEMTFVKVSNDFGNTDFSNTDFDWTVLERIRKLEAENERLKAELCDECPYLEVDKEIINRYIDKCKSHEARIAELESENKELKAFTPAKLCELCGGSGKVEIKDCASCVHVNDNGQCRMHSPCADKSLVERFIRNPLLKIRYKPCPNGCKKGSEE